MVSSPCAWSSSDAHALRPVLSPHTTQGMIFSAVIVRASKEYHTETFMLSLQSLTAPASPGTGDAEPGAPWRTTKHARNTRPSYTELPPSHLRRPSQRRASQQHRRSTQVHLGSVMRTELNDSGIEIEMSYFDKPVELDSVLDCDVGVDEEDEERARGVRTAELTLELAKAGVV